ncbi:MAG: hypothetical protein HRF44_04060 [Ignavibacterium sp.]|jgi:hypothetical protein
MKRTARKSFLVLLLVILSGACKDELPTGVVVFPESNVSYSRHIEPLWTQKCLSCHQGSTPPDLTPPSYTSLMTYQPQLVIPGQGYNSLLVQMLDGRIGPPMPPSEKLNENQIKGIMTWINEGAQNN